MNDQKLSTQTAAPASAASELPSTPSALALDDGQITPKELETLRWYCSLNSTQRQLIAHCLDLLIGVADPRAKGGE
jgi:enterochelin esterase-like enzyme